MRWEALDETIGIPERSTTGSAGYDLISAEDYILEVGKRHAFGTGVTAEFCQGVCLDIRPRSGMAVHNGVTVLNADGLIDSDYYPKEIKVILINHGEEDILIERGMKIAQAVFGSYFLAQNDRCTGEKRTGGMGSTGR